MEVRQSDGTQVHRTVYERDLLGRIRKVTDPLGNEQIYTYDAFGRVLDKVDEDGYKTAFRYTENGSVQKISYADGKTVQMEYDSMKRLAEIRDWTGITQLEYDDAGRIAKVTDPMEREVSYEWGSMDERRSVTYPDGTRVQYEYDEALRLKALNHNGQKITYQYGSDGQIKEKQYPNQVKTTYRYDREGLLTELTHEDSSGVLDQYRYQYDAVGNRISTEKFRRDAREENGIYQYRYDGLGRLTEVVKDDNTLRSYTYDGFGNRIGMEDRTGRTVSHFNERNQLIRTDTNRGGEKNTFRYAYDKRGNLLSESKNGAVEKNYTFGPLNRLQAVKNMSGEEVTFTYNGLLQRVKSERGSQNIRYILDMTKGYHNLLGTEENGALQSYLWDEGLAAVVGAADTVQPSYCLEDEMGSASRIMSAGGETIQRYGYDEFGQDLYGSQGRTQPFGYTGYQIDGLSGLYFAQARYYNAGQGRFVSADIRKGFAEDPRSLNEYGYVWQNPYRYTDDDGEFPHVVAAAFGGAMVGGLWEGGKELVRQVKSGEKIDLAKAGKMGAVGAVKGAVDGVLVSTGAGLATKIVTKAVTGAVTSAAEQKIRNNSVNVAKALVDGAIDGATTGIFEGSVGKKITKGVDDLGEKLLTKIGGKQDNFAKKAVINVKDFIFKESDTKAKTVWGAVKDNLKKKVRDIAKPSTYVKKGIKKLSKFLIPKGAHLLLCAT